MGLLVLPLVAQQFGDAWVRILALALLYVLLALGLNIVVGYAGLLDLGYVAFYAVGAYMYRAAGRPAPDRELPVDRAAVPRRHARCRSWSSSRWRAGLAGVVRRAARRADAASLRGDYLAIVTLGFGEIIRVFLNNLEHPINITNGPRGLDRHRLDAQFFGLDLGQRDRARAAFGFRRSRCTTTCSWSLVVLSVVVCHRLERSRIGRAWMAIREDEIAAKAMGINTRNMKLLAFGMGATFGGVSGVDVRGLPGLRLARVLHLMESS